MSHWELLLMKITNTPREICLHSATGNRKSNNDDEHNSDLSALARGAAYFHQKKNMLSRGTGLHYEAHAHQCDDLRTGYRAFFPAMADKLFKTMRLAKAASAFGSLHLLLWAAQATSGLGLRCRALFSRPYA